MTDIIEEFHDTLTALLGPSVNNNIHFGIVPANAVFPLVVYGLIWGGTGRRASGDRGTYRSRFQVDLYAKTVDELLALRHTAIVGLRGLSSGIMIDSRLDMDVHYFVDALDAWRHIIDVSIDSELES